MHFILKSGFMKQLSTLLFTLSFVLSLGAQRVIPVTGTYSDIAYVPSRDALYAVRPAAATEQANTLCRIDPQTGAVLQSIYVGEDPDRVVATTSGNYLYISFRGEATIRRFDVSSGEIDLSFSPGGIESNTGPYFVDDLLPIRGSDDLLAVARRNDCCYPRQEGVVLFDRGRQLPAKTANERSSNFLAYTDLDDVIIGASPEIDYALRRMEITDQGVAMPQEFYLEAVFTSRIEYADGRLYEGNGQVARLENGFPIYVGYAYTYLQNYSGQIATEPVPAANRIYYLGQNGNGRLELVEVNATTLEVLKQYQLSTQRYSYTGGRALERLQSDDHLAFLTGDGQLGLVTLCTSTLTTVPPPYAGPSFICFDDSLRITAPVGELAAGQDILWSNGKMGTSIFVANEGEYSYQIVDAGGCPGPASEVFYLNRESSRFDAIPIAEPITDVICRGGSLELRPQYEYGTSVVWNTGDTTPVLTVTEPGNYRAAFITDYGCPSEFSEPFTVTALDEPAPAAPVVDQGTRIDTCTNNALLLSVSGNAPQYYWSGSPYGGYEAGYGSFVLYGDPSQPSEFSVFAEGFNGCLSATTTGTVIFRRVPDAPFIQFNESTGTLASNLRGPLLWYYQDELEGESSGRFYKPQRNGFYTARLKGTDCPSEPSNEVSVTGIVTTATRDEEYSRRVQIYPNPVSDRIYVSFEGSLAAELARRELDYQLFSVSGALVSRGVIDPHAKNTPIAVNDLASGVYVLTFVTEGRAILRKRVTIM